MPRSSYQILGFNIVHAAFDTDSAAWSRDVKKDGREWPYHFVAFKRNGEELAKKYGVKEIPTTYLIDIFRGIILRGANLGDLWEQGLVLTVMSVFMITVAAMRFRKKTG